MTSINNNINRYQSSKRFKFICCYRSYLVTICIQTMNLLFKLNGDLPLGIFVLNEYNKNYINSNIVWDEYMI